MTKLKLLITITDDNKEDILKHIYNQYNISLKTSTSGVGTASPSLLDYFGLTETKKQIFLAVIPDYLEHEIIKDIYDKLSIGYHGAGVSFTIAIKSANKFLLDSFENKETKKENETMEETTKYYLIITIVLEGHLEQVMESAKRMGATGGTVIRGRGLGNKDAVKMFGFEIEPGREIVLNIVDKNIKNNVMEEITKNVGIKTPGRGVCIALPIDEAIGINSQEKI